MFPWVVFSLKTITATGVASFVVTLAMTWLAVATPRLRVPGSRSSFGWRHPFLAAGVTYLGVKHIDRRLEDRHRTR